MRRHLLVGIIVILLFLPGAMHLVRAQDLTQFSQSTLHDYNFTSLAIGTHPANMSWISFQDINETPSFSSIVENSSIGRGLRVYNGNYSTQSYLEINLTDSSSLNLHMDFSWNTAAIQGLTNNTISCYKNGTKLFGFAFGTLSRETILSNHTSSSSIGAMLPYTTRINLTLSFNSTYPGLAVARFNTSGSGTSSFPMELKYPVVKGENISLRIGGNYANVTIYDLDESTGSPLNFPVLSNNELRYNSSSFSLNSNFPSNVSAGTMPYLDSKLNSIIYPARNSTIVRYNYYNLSSEVLLKLHANITGGISFDGTLYYWSNGTNVDVYGFNESTLQLTEYQTRQTIVGKVFSHFTSNYVILYNTKGHMVKYNLENRTVSAVFNASFSSGGGAFKLLSSLFQNGTVALEAYSNGTREISMVRYNISTLGQVSRAVESYSELVGSISISKQAVKSDGIASVFKIKDNVTGSYLTNKPGAYELPVKNESLTYLAGSGGNLVTVSKNGTIAYLSDNETLTQTNIPALSHNSSIWTAANLSEIATLSGTSLSIYYSGPSLPLSNSRIKIASKSSYLIRGISFLNFTVESTLPYKISLSTAGMNMNISNSSSFEINSSVLPEGNHTAQINATNSAGYAWNISTLIEVDNAIPNPEFTPSNGSFISNSTRISFNISDIVGIQESNVTYLSSNLTFKGSKGVFYLEAVNYTGPIKIKFLITDSYGYHFEYNVSYTIPGYSGNDNLSLWSGEYLNKTVQIVSWSLESNVTSYTLGVSSVSGEENITTNSTQLKLNLSNGNHTLTLYETLVNNNTLKIAESNVTVISYSPHISVTRLPTGTYSFNGNSKKSNFSTVISSNITSYLNTTIEAPSGEVVYSAHTYNETELNFASLANVLVTNGKYLVKYIAISLSGTSASGKFTISVNNTIPASPLDQPLPLYTNTSEVLVKLQMEPYLNYSISLTLGNKTISLGEQYIPQVPLLLGTGIYTLNVTVTSESGNHNSSDLEIFKYNHSPRISLSLPKDLIDRNYTRIEYSISDMAPLKNITLNINGTRKELHKTTGMVNLTFDMNGLYNISMNVNDLCGNHNTSGYFSLNVSYYIKLKNPVIETSHSGKMWHFSLSSSGNGLNRTTITWYVDGKQVANASDFNQTLGVGKHVIRSVIEFQGKSVTVSKTVYVLGAVPYITAAVVGTSIVAERLLIAKRDPEKARKIIADLLGMPLATAVKAGRSQRITSGTIRKQARRMQDEGKLAIRRDPDGNKYIMGPEWGDRKRP